MRNVFRQIKRFRNSKTGNIAVIFAIALVPVLSFLGSAIDYSRATKVRTKLQSGDRCGKRRARFQKPRRRSSPPASMTVDGPIPAGVTDATNIFNGNMNGVTGFTLNSMTAAVTQDRGTVTSTASVFGQGTRRRFWA